MYQHGGDIYHYQKILDFSTNVNLMGTPIGVIEALEKGARLCHQYPDTNCTQLRMAISEKENIPMPQIICGNGAADLIYALVLAVQPQKALLPVPSFFEYEQALNVVKCHINYFQTKKEKGFLLQEDFLEQITGDVELIFLCNPNNPTGHLIEAGLLDKIIEKCWQHNSLLVVDECFMDFVKKEECYSVKKKWKKYKNIFILKAFTKLYTMPGVRLGYGICQNEDLIKKMKEVCQPWSVSLLAQMAGVAALKETNYVRESMEVLNQERQYLFHEFRKLNLAVIGSKANYLFFSAEPDLYEKCLEKGILIRDCSNYRGLEKGYYRIAVKNHLENIEFIKVLKEVQGNGKINYDTGNDV
ncbi:pyridoxal phosphate-dependent aminotransferase [Anaeromicropila populeti]|uniref:L-threonine O-3-phosphate decarboxylase n=1 Tax=Anaeromicropila populeti TaxID=37658 RepID=A0A1I6J0X8_9FIRM|nr:histidinol-phosphate transaminase [Anaeromicropila populeti]SFR72662.1 L-threonine O-3-phosphate decarboxylase [Anaeromicropila populeti]